MDRSETEIGTLAPSSIDGDEDVFGLVDRWISEFEVETDVHLETPAARTTAARPHERRHDTSPPSSLDSMRADWSRVASGSRRRSSASDRSDTNKPDADALPLRSNGLLTTFTDAMGGTISLTQTDGRLQHRGTIAVRGRDRAIDAACHSIGLPDHVTRGFEFVAAWFGLPFDAVNVRGGDGQILTWGFCGFSGHELAACLHEWKRESRASFDACLATFGIDVTAGESEIETDRLPALIVPSGKRHARGRDAEWIVASEPRLLAALARSGRDSTAQKAQIDMAIAAWVTPVMFHPWEAAGGDDLLTLDVLKSARTVAVLLYLVRRHGVRAATRLVHAANERSRTQDDEEAWLAGVVRSLRHLRREHEASEVLRISSSPELMQA